MIIQTTTDVNSSTATGVRQASSFLDFIKRVDRKYDDNTKQIFLVLDNTSIHKSKIVKETLARYHPSTFGISSDQNA
jgi:hypothetical protein